MFPAREFQAETVGISSIDQAGFRLLTIVPGRDAVQRRVFRAGTPNLALKDQRSGVSSSSVPSQCIANHTRHLGGGRGSIFFLHIASELTTRCQHN